MSCLNCPIRSDTLNGPIPGRYVGPPDGSPVIMVGGESYSPTTKSIKYLRVIEVIL